MTEPIQGKVAKVLTEYSVVLNVGSDHGVTEGMKFAVLSKPVAVYDPDSGNEIGNVSLTIGRVEVYEVHPKFSLAGTYVFSGPLPYVTLLERPSRKREKLPVDNIDLASVQEKIKEGNLVKQIV